MKYLEKKEIITLFLHQSDWITSSFISQTMDLSVRTIKNFISELNSETANLIQSSNRGYKINRDLIGDSKILSNANFIIPDSYKDRGRYILLELFFAKTSLNFFNLCDDLFISNSTLNNELSKLRKEIKKYSLSLHSKKQYIYLKGSVSNIADLAISLFEEELGTNIFNLFCLQKYFSHIKLSEIKNLIFYESEANGYYLDDISLLNITLRVSIEIEISLLNNDYTNASNYNALMIDDPEYFCPCRVIQKINLLLKHDISKLLSSKTLKLLSTRLIPDCNKLLELKESYAPLNIETCNLLTDISSQIQKKYPVKISDKQSLLRFGYHLNNLLLSHKQSNQIKNNAFSHLEIEDSLLKSISQFVAAIILDKTNIELDPFEINLIALHLSAMIDHSRSSQPIKCVLFAPNYCHIDRIIYDRINVAFGGFLRITEIIAFIDDITIFNGIDLLLSTTPLNEKIDIPSVHISPFFSPKDIRNILNAIELLGSNPKMNYSGVSQHINY